MGSKIDSPVLTMGFMASMKEK
ncbi:uncharacterized protein G2W53_035033 [Senna tora]|uniref:Uncharacterized protein n=1 Tax=Senna tora TaxID=362788 RepID=A0A834SST9_9FABA|nr:uncharacterized protein G2W53_035033 [Senna tora]